MHDSFKYLTMELIISRKFQTITFDPDGKKGLKQTLGHIILEDKGKEVMSFTSLERPKRKVKQVSRIPAGRYKYKMFNKTPECPFAFIRLVGTGYDINCVDDYTDNTRTIIVGKTVTVNGTHYNLEGQRESLTKLCKVIPETGYITIRDEPETDIREKIRAQDQANYQF